MLLKEQSIVNIQQFWHKHLAIFFGLLLGVLVGGIVLGIVIALWKTSPFRTTTQPVLGCTKILNFDNVTNGSSAVIPNGYGGVNWQNLAVLNGLNQNNGYRTGVISPPYVVYPMGARAGSITPNVTRTTFTLFSFYSAAAYQNETNLTMIGTRSGLEIYKTSVTLVTTNVTQIVLDWIDVDNVTMSALTPTNQATWFTIDNLCLD